MDNSLQVSLPFLSILALVAKSKYVSHDAASTCGGSELLSERLVSELTGGTRSSSEQTLQVPGFEEGAVHNMDSIFFSCALLFCSAQWN